MEVTAQECVPLLPAVDVEKASLSPAKKPEGWKTMPYIIGNEAFEKVASYGLTANMTVYLVEKYRIQEVAAANIGVLFGGTSNFMPLFGAFLSDAYLGRYRTLALGCIFSFLGMVSWTIASLVPRLQPPSCTEMFLQTGQCIGPTKAQLSFLYFSMGLLALGAGGVRPASLPFGVDQFDSTTEQGKKGMDSFFNWYYYVVTVAGLFSMTVIVYIQDSVSWSIGFAIPTFLMLLSIIFFFSGNRHYVKVPVEGSIFSSIAQVIVVSFRKRNLKLKSPDCVEQGSLFYDPPLTTNRNTKLPLSQQYRFLNKAALICDSELNPDGSRANVWRLCTIQQIEELKCIMRIMPIWASGITCFMALGQQWSFGVLQALKMDRSLGPNFQIPAGAMAGVGMFGIVLFIPIYDQILVPALRRITKKDGGITILQRQGVGIVISTLSMFLAAFVETLRRDSKLSHEGVSPMSVGWLVPQLVLMGIGESFNAIGQIEFYNRQFPESLLTLAGSLFCLSQAVASYMTSLLIEIIQMTTGRNDQINWLDNDINEGRLDYYYYVIATMGVLNLFYFLLCANSYRYKGS